MKQEKEAGDITGNINPQPASDTINPFISVPKARAVAEVLKTDGADIAVTQYLQILFREAGVLEEELSEEELEKLANDPKLWEDPTPEELAFFDQGFDERVFAKVMAYMQENSPAKNQSLRDSANPPPDRSGDVVALPTKNGLSVGPKQY